MMKRLVKNKSCLVLLNDEIVQKRKFKQILNELFEKNYKFFYFIYNNLASKTTGKLIKIEKGNTKCYCAFDHKLILENYKDFDAYLPIEEKGVNEKIEWALRGCGAVITDFEIFDKDLRDKYSFELHKV